MNKLIPLVMFVSFTMTFSGCISDKAGTSSNPVVLKSPHGRLAAAMVVSPALTKDKVKGPLKLFILAGPFTPTAEKANQGGQWRSEPPADCPFKSSTSLTGVEFTGRHAEYTGADTWYPSWAADGCLERQYGLCDPYLQRPFKLKLY